MAREYPAAGFALLLIAGILELLVGIPMIFLGTMFSFAASYASHIAGAVVGICFAWFLIMGILIILAAIWVHSGDPKKVHNGGILGLIASILGIGPFFLTLILGVIGGALALSWKPPQRAPIPPPPM